MESVLFLSKELARFVAKLLVLVVIVAVVVGLMAGSAPNHILF